MSSLLYTEIEAKFLNIDKEEMRKKLTGVGAILVRREYDQKRVNFQLPPEKRSDDKWLRVRDDGDKITMSLKEITGETISDQKEISIIVDNFESAVQFLSSIGCARKGVTFTKRELWKLSDVEITIDTWPFFEPFIEIEGKSEDVVREVAEQLGLNFDQAVFGAVGKLYKDRYGVSLDEIEKEVGDIAFDNEKMGEMLKVR